MAKILIQFAHPLFEKSRVQKVMLKYARQLSGVTINDLYEQYPDFEIDIKREQQLLLAHDIIIFQHPFYWYSSPAIVKQWMDLVLEHGWAYGSKGDMLRGKWIMQAITCGGSQPAYRSEGRNRFSINHFLAPMDQTARLCLMDYLPPFVVFGTHKLGEDGIEQCGLQYAQVLTALHAGSIQKGEWQSVEYINSLCPIPEQLQS